MRAIGIIVGLGFLAALVYATLRETAVSCEVCIEFAGQSACRRAKAADRDQALQMAQSTACAVLSGGVTQGMQCNRTPARSESCDDA